MTVAADIVSVEVSVADASVTRAGFGTPLVFAYHTHSPDAVLTFSASTYAAAMTALGFATTEPARLAMDRVFSQRPRPKTAKLGKKTVAPTQILRITPTVLSGSAAQTDSFTIEAADGTTYAVTFTSDATPSVAELCTGIAAAINATAVAMTASGVSGTHVELTADATNTLHSVYGFNTTRLTLTDVTLSSSVSADLDACEAFDNDWYGLALASGAPTEIEAAADWIESRYKVMIAQTHDMGVIGAGSTDIASSIESQSYNNTRVVYNGRALSFAGAGLLAQLLTFEPGQSTTDAKTIVGAVADGLTSGQSTNAHNKNSITYESILGRAMTVDLATGGGRFLDITMIVHWVIARLQEGYIAKKLAAPKIPYTDQGIGAAMYGVCRNVVSQGIDNGAIDPDPTTWSIEVPKVADQDAADRAARHFPGTELAFRATGAAHTVDVAVNIGV